MAGKSLTFECKYGLIGLLPGWGEVGSRRYHSGSKQFEGFFVRRFRRHNNFGYGCLALRWDDSGELLVKERGYWGREFARRLRGLGRF